jgi:hypothetical protein
LQYSRAIQGAANPDVLGVEDLVAE